MAELFALADLMRQKIKTMPRWNRTEKYADLQFMEEGEERIYVDFCR